MSDSSNPAALPRLPIAPATAVPPASSAGGTVAADEAAQPLTTSLMMGYGVGQAGGQIFRDAPAVLLPLFMASMLGVPPWMAGLSILLPKLWIIFCDPLVGSFSDRRRAAWGRGPFLLVGGVLSGFGFFALFVPPDFSQPWMAALYNMGIFLVAQTAFSLFSVPYLSLASELTADTHERTKLLSFRLGFTAVGLVIGAGVAQPMVGWYGGGRTGYGWMGATLGAFCLLAMVGTWLFTRRAKLLPASSEVLPLRQQLQVALENKPFRLIAAIYFVQQLGAAVGYTVLGLFFIYVYQNIGMIIAVILIMGVMAIVSQAPWVMISKRIGKRATYILCVVVWTLVTLSWLWVKPGTDVLVTLPWGGGLSSQDVGMLVRSLLIGIFNSGFVLMGFSMLTDTIDFERRRSGMSRQGLMSGLFSSIEKLAFALGPLIAGIVLSATGFVESKGGPVAQSAGSVQGIQITFAAIPALLFALSLLLLRRYTLDENVLATTGRAAPATPADKP